MQNKFLNTLLIAFSIPLLTNATIHRVEQGSTCSSGCGGGWGNLAFPDLQGALDIAAPGDEIWVAEGTYYPSKDIYGTPTSSKYATFMIPDGVILYGGYPAGGGTRDWDAHPVILSGNIGNLALASDNSYNVVWLAVGGTHLVDGFIIQDGRMDNTISVLYGGAGMYCRDVTGSINNCIIRNNENTSSIGGGGVSVTDCNLNFNSCTFSYNKTFHANANGGGLKVFNGTTTFNNCSFDHNSSIGPGGGVVFNGGDHFVYFSTFKENSAFAGGGISHHGSPGNFVVEDSYFEENSAGAGGAIQSGPTTTASISRNVLVSNLSIYEGGAVRIDGVAILTDCYFEFNKGRRGGGLDIISPPGINVDVINCIFHKNTADNEGGGISAWGNVEVINSVCHDNKARYGGGQYNWNDSDPKFIHNSIYWDNTATVAGNDIYDMAGSAVTVLNCMLQSYPAPWPNLIGIDPLFVNAANPYGPDQLIRTPDDGLFVQSSSAALNFGDDGPVISHGVGFDFIGSPRIMPPSVDVGAYEGSMPCTIDSILYVDINATGAFTGACWTDALREVRDAIALIPSYPNVTTIKVAQGTYYPTSNPLDRSASFVLPSNIKILGGYPTGGGVRDFVLNVCTLSGDIGAGGVQSDNSYHVVRASNASENTLLDGFTIQLGKTDNTQPYGGAGMYLYNSDIMIKNCIFDQNASDISGGGIYADQSSIVVDNCQFILNTATGGRGGAFHSPTSFFGSFSNCVFNGNSAKFGGAVESQFIAKGLFSYCNFESNSATSDGGAIYLDNRSFPNFESCRFISNHANGVGGAIFSRQFGPEHKKYDIYLCVFEANTANVGGGAVYNIDYSSPRLLNSVFYQNSAPLGGVIYNTSNCQPEIVNCTFFANDASSDGGVLYNTVDSKPTLSNSIMYNNTSAGAPDVQNLTGSSTYMIYSLSQVFGTGGVNGNLVGVNPLFVNDAVPKGGDGYLGNDNDGLKLKSISPCIDKGASVYIPSGVVGDIAGNNRFQGATVDMGAYESPYGSPVDVFPDDYDDIQAFQGCNTGLPQVTKDVVNDFGAVPDDGFDDTPAFVAASYWLRTNSSPTQRLVLTIPAGEYNIGVQVDYLSTWVSGSVSYTNNTYVKMGINIFDLYNAQNITVKGEEGAVMKFNDNMYFGGYDALLNPTNQTYATAPPKAATVGSMFRIKECDCIAIQNLELHGNDSQIQLGGTYNDGYQLGYDGITIFNSTNIEVSKVYSHNHGRDGIMVHRQEPTDPMPQDIFMYKSQFVQNGRQGLSWTAGDTIRAKSCSFNESAMGAIQNRLGAGIDIESENGICINGYFQDCEMIGSRFSQIHADRDVNAGWRVGNVHFDNCFVWAKPVGSSAWGIWPTRMRNSSFTNCKIYGSILHVGGNGPLDYLKFENCYFSDEGPDGEAVFYSSGTIFNMGSGPGFNTTIDNLNYDYANNVFHQFTNNVIELHRTNTAQNVLFTEYGSANSDNYPAFRTFECNEFRYFTNDIFSNMMPYGSANCPNSLGLYGGYFFNSNMFSNRFVDMNPVDPGGASLPNIPWTCSTSYYISVGTAHNNSNGMNTILPKSIEGARHSRVSWRPNPLGSWGRLYSDF